MVKIKRSYVRNIKSIDEFEANFDGATAFVIGGNTKGKTTLISFLLDRLAGNKQYNVLKDDSKDGVARIDMTDGCSFEYTILPDGKEKLTYIHHDVKVKATRDIIDKYIGKRFDMDAFLNMQPKEKVNYLLKIFNVNITEERDRLNNLINERRTFKKIAQEKKAILDSIERVEGEMINIDLLYQEKDNIIKEYEEKRKAVDEKNKIIKEEYQARFDEAFNKMLAYNAKQNRLAEIHNMLSEWMRKADEYDELKELKDVIGKHKEKIEQPKRIYTIDDLKQKMPEPVLQNDVTYPYDKIKEIDKKIEEAIKFNNKLKNNQEYEIKEKDYQDTINVLNNIENEIAALEKDIKNKLSNVKLPKEITIDIDNEQLLYNGKVISKDTLATSELYIAALMIGTLTLKELKMIHFDCSPLDKVSLQRVIEFANEADLQILIEKPDYEAGELKYEIVESNQ